jgi:CubicO group peptidase (beta-lactamase class C family)
MHSDTFRKLVERAQALLQEHEIPGAALAVLHDGQVEEAGVGVTSLPHPLPVTADTRFQIGSITKTMLGTAVMRLLEQGRLELDAPLRQYLPGLRLRDPKAQEWASMRHVLTHTGGWLGDYFDDLGPGDDALRRMVEERMPELPQELPLGAAFSYNNAGYYLAGRAIELITGARFEDAMAELVFGPLGLERSHFFAEDVMLHRFAVGHIKREAGPEVAAPWPLGRASHPAGGVVSTVGDLLRYAQAHFPGESPLLSAESRAQMQTPQASAIGDYEHVGLTWFMRNLGGVRALRHSGGTNGQIADLWLVPSRGFALAILTNASNGGLLTRPLFLQAIGDYLGLDDPDPAPVAVPAERLRGVAGRYVGVLADGVVELADGGLVLHGIPKGGFPRRDSPPAPTPPPTPIAFYDDTCVVATEGPLKSSRGEFGGWEGGRPRWFRFGGRARLRQDSQ